MKRHNLQPSFRESSDSLRQQAASTNLPMPSTPASGNGVYALALAAICLNLTAVSGRWAHRRVPRGMEACGRPGHPCGMLRTALTGIDSPWGTVSSVGACSGRERGPTDRLLPPDERFSLPFQDTEARKGGALMGKSLTVVRLAVAGEGPSHSSVPVGDVKEVDGIVPVAHEDFDCPIRVGVPGDVGLLAE